MDAMTAPPRTPDPPTSPVPTTLRLVPALLTCAHAISCAAPATSPAEIEARAPSAVPVLVSTVVREDTDAPDAGATMPPAVPKGPAECKRDEWSAAIPVARICDDSRWKCTVTDCKDGQIEVPYWLRGVHFWDVLCVHAEKRKQLVNYGDTLMSKAEIKAGDPRSQGYYALSQPPPIELGQREPVWAVCGGGGAQLAFGTEVVVMPGLPDKKAIELAELVDLLTVMEKDLQFFRNEYCEAPGAKKEEYLVRLKALRAQLDEAASRLRGGIMGEHRVLLQP
jgi:hypothetical protein